MLFLALPNELIAKVLRFVTPPLPVPTSTTTFLPEVLQARGDNEGEWKDIGSLMLDSKAMKEHAAPFFWSHLEVTSIDRANALVGVFLDDALAGELVRSVTFSGAERATAFDPHDRHAYALLYTWLSHVEQLSFSRPYPFHLDHLFSFFNCEVRHLKGIHGLPVSLPLVPSAMLFLKSNRNTLLHVSLLQVSGSRHGDPIWPSMVLFFPKLQSISLDRMQPRDDQLPSLWLEKLVNTMWSWPLIAKFGLGLQGCQHSRTATKRKWEEPMLVSCKQYRGLGEFLRDWKEWPTRDAKEDEEDEENEEDEEEQISLTEATFLLPGTGLDDITIKRLKKLKLSPLPFLERVIIVQKQPFRKALDFADLLSALTSVLSAELLPGLRSIIWVLPKDAVQESSLWPGSILNWMLKIRDADIKLTFI